MWSSDFTSNVNPFAVKLHTLTDPELRALWIILDQLEQYPLDQVPPFEVIQDAYIRLVAFFIRLGIAQVGSVCYDN